MVHSINVWHKGGSRGRKIVVTRGSPWPGALHGSDCPGFWLLRSEPLSLVPLTVRATAPKAQDQFFFIIKFIGVTIVNKII